LDALCDYREYKICGHCVKAWKKLDNIIGREATFKEFCNHKPKLFPEFNEEVRIMAVHLCPKCGSAMVRASVYDPDGLISLYGGEREYDAGGSLAELWVCVDRKCEDGRRNTAQADK